MGELPLSLLAERFLAAAKKRKMSELAAFLKQEALIRTTGNLIHALQRERGISNLFAVSTALKHAEMRNTLIKETDSQISQFLSAQPLSLYETEYSIVGPRLLIQMAVALQDIDKLSGVRQQVVLGQATPATIIQSYSNIIHALLCVVFESADMLIEPTLAKPLIALFNIMQCKELAGRERATGAAVFSGAKLTPSLLKTWPDLINAQDQCLQIVAEFADTHTQQMAEAITHLPEYGEFERLRRRACTATHDQKTENLLGQHWFDIASNRMDVLKSIEDHLTQVLQQQCQEKLLYAQEHPLTVDELTASAHDDSCFVVLYPPSDHILHKDNDVQHYPGDALSPRIGREIIELLYHQSRQLQETKTALSDTRHALEERKLLAKAKGLLMKQRNLTEDQAHRLMQSVAMNQHQSLFEVATLFLALNDGTK